MKKENRITLLVPGKVNGQSQSKTNGAPLVAELELTNCKIAGLPETETKESLDFRFHRREFERCLPEINSSVYAKLGLSLEKAIALLESKPKISKGNITLSVDESETLRRVLRKYKIVLDKYSRAACHGHGFLAVIDEAGALYRGHNQSAALKKIGWRAGKRQPTVPHADIFMNYLLLMANRKSSRESRMEAIKILQEHFGDKGTPDAIIKSLQRTLASFKRKNPTFNVIIPSPNTEPSVKRKRN